MEPIAIVGMSCRFPGADNPTEFWRLLRDGTDMVREIPAERWNHDQYFDADPKAPGKMLTRWGGFLGPVDGFDAAFFSIAPREVLRMDPQQRLLLELSWEALEDAGIVPQSLASTATGVFIGFGVLEYSFAQIKDPNLIDGYTNTGYFPCIMSNRISYAFDFRGPSMSVDTACSSSLVAIQLACASLRSGASTVALSGGVSLMLEPATTIGFSKLSAMSPDGRCHTFDAAANGYVRGEGAGLLVLKLLSQAQADGDDIYALIRGEAVNQDGRSNGLTAPSGRAQEAVLRAAYANAGVSPGQVQYVEAHGTGTFLGDPIEAQALGTVLATGRPAGNRCSIGSLKTNIGHLEAAAGVASVIKVALSMRHGWMLPQLHFKTPNPHIAFDRLPLKVQTALEPWPKGSTPMLAGVSSFGFGGTNAHLVLEGPPVAESQKPSLPEEPRAWQLLPIAARHPAALKELAMAYGRQIAESPGSWPAICRGAAHHRSHHDYRLSITAGDAAGACEALEAFAAGKPNSRVASGRAASNRRPKIAMLFTGQGAQYVGMGRRLYDCEPVFRKSLERSSEILNPHLAQPLLSVLYPEAGDTSPLDDTAYAQPALFALEYALAELWESWGVQPVALLGHSLGEYVAACRAGMLSLEDGLALVALRGRLMSQLPRTGGMAAVFTDAARVAAVLAPFANRLSIAALNGPENVVISGANPHFEEVLSTFASQGIATQRLNVSHAFHSPLVDAMLDEYAQTVQRIRFSPPRVTLISNITGQPLDRGETLDASYLCRHTRESVQFAAGMRSLAELGCETFLEIGPGTTLLGLGRRSVTGDSLVWLPSLRQGRDVEQQMTESLGALYTRGVNVRWANVFPGPTSRRLKLPAYPFQRQRYWVEPAERRDGASAAVELPAAGPALHPLLGTPARSALPLFESRFTRAETPWLWEHVIFGTPIVPGTAWLEMARAAADAHFGPGEHAVERVVFLEPMKLRDSQPAVVQLVVLPDGAFRIASLEQNAGTESWHQHCQGHLVRGGTSTQRAEPASCSAEAARCRDEIDVASQYAALQARGLDYGPAFRRVTRLWRGNAEAVGSIDLLPTDTNHGNHYRFHPAILDACLHVAAAALSAEDGLTNDQQAWLPHSIDRATVFRQPDGTLVSHAAVRPAVAGNQDTRTVDLRIFDGDENLVAEIVGLNLIRTAGLAAHAAPSDPIAQWLYKVQWQPQPPSPAGRAERQIGPRIIISDGSPWAATLCEHIAARHETCIFANAQNWQRVLKDVDQAGSHPRNVVYLASPDRESIFAQAGSELSASVQASCAGLLHLVQSLERATADVPNLWLVTGGVAAVGPQAVPQSLGQAPLAGMARTLALEAPKLNCRHLDLDPAGTPDELAAALLAEMDAGGAENQLAYRAGQRYAARLVRLADEPAETSRRLELPAAAACQLDTAGRGVLDHLVLRPVERRPPGPGEVEIEVRATGLNFRDVLNALGMYPGDAGPLGGECSGVVVSVGSGVEGLQPGTEVVAIAQGSFATFVTVPALFVATKPRSLTFAEAAAAPIAFLTAWLALNQHGRMAAGDRVLIHAATGGVGLAAVQLAQRAAAVVFATAGSVLKRELLSACRVPHVMNSRTLDFANDVRRAHGQGLDIVLNSLAGEFIPRSLELLRPGGRFIEIGKTGIWNAAQAKALNPGVEYFVLDLVELSHRQPELIHATLAMLMAEFDAGSLSPLPCQAFSIQQAPSAFRWMAQARHIGKVVLTQPVAVRAEPLFRDDASYLVTGGLGGLGLKLAEWMIERGARHLVLLGRSPPTAAAAELLLRLRKTGAQVVTVQADVAEPGDVDRVFRDTLSMLPPLAGVMHAAGVLDDATIAQQSSPRFEHVLRPKVAGTWNLHAATRALPLDFFVCFSSIAALIGSPGQINYSAANAFQDALIHERQRQGLPGLSINWGPWSEVGMAAAHGTRDLAGLHPIAPEAGLQALERLLGQQEPQVAVLPVDWPKFLERLPPAAAPLLAAVASTPRTASLAQRAAGDLRQRMEAAPQSQRGAIAITYLSEMAAHALGLPDPRVIDPRQPLRELGLDSLMAVEMRNALEVAIAAPLPTTLLFDYPTLEALAEHLTQRTAEHSANGDARGSTGPDEAADSDLERMTDDEIAGLLAGELATLRRAGGGAQTQGAGG
jgi:myxalamid-type polyketide synthase MxaB